LVPLDFARAAHFARQAIEQVLASGLEKGQVASINIPALQSDESPRGIKVVRQCTRPFIDRYERRKDPRGRDYFWNSSVFTLGESEDDTDVAALRNRWITVTPLQFDLTDHRELTKWQARQWLGTR
jgi:5'-nucleotidase